MTVMLGGFELGRAHADMWRQVGRAERVEEQAAEARAEAAAYRSAATAEAQREAYDVAGAAVDRRTAAAEAAAQREREERQAEQEDWRAVLLSTGQARWRTVEEVLAAARGGWPAAFPAEVTAAAHRQEEAVVGQASRANAGERFRAAKVARAFSCPPADPTCVRLAGHQAHRQLRTISLLVRDQAPGHSRERTGQTVFAEYGLAYSAHDAYEVDHLIPLELGGSNAISNLRPQPEGGSRPGYPAKDKLAAARPGWPDSSARRATATRPAIPRHLHPPGPQVHLRAPAPHADCRRRVC